LAFARSDIIFLGEKNAERAQTMNTGALFFISFGLPAIIAALAYIAFLLHEREWRKHRDQPGE